MFLCTTAVHAQDVHVPGELEDWRGWVLEGEEYRQCPAYFDRSPAGEADFLCAWPQVLELDVDADGGRFAQRWLVSAGEAWLPLPGNTDYWPDRVTANGEPVTVVLHDGVPSVRVRAGNHQLEGRFRWDERPGVLSVPPQSGLVELAVNGAPVARPVLNRNGVFLGDRSRPSQTPDSLEASVYRLVMDDVPLRLGTVLRLDVSGTVRVAGAPRNRRAPACAGATRHMGNPVACPRAWRRFRRDRAGRPREPAVRGDLELPVERPPARDGGIRRFARRPRPGQRAGGLGRVPRVSP
jgi:hypothetical protein